jgi:hypothetical protein
MRIESLKNTFFYYTSYLKIAFRTFRTWASELFVEVVLGAAPIFYTFQRLSNFKKLPIFFNVILIFSKLNIDGRILKPTFRTPPGKKYIKLGASNNAL